MEQTAITTPGPSTAPDMPLLSTDSLVSVFRACGAMFPTVL